MTEPVRIDVLKKDICNNYFKKVVDKAVQAKDGTDIRSLLFRT